MAEWYFRRTGARTDSRMEHFDNEELFYARNFETNAMNATKLPRNAENTQKNRFWSGTRNLGFRGPEIKKNKNMS